MNIFKSFWQQEFETLKERLKNAEDTKVGTAVNRSLATDYPTEISRTTKKMKLNQTLDKKKT